MQDNVVPVNRSQFLQKLLQCDLELMEVRTSLTFYFLLTDRGSRVLHYSGDAGHRCLLLIYFDAWDFIDIPWHVGLLGGVRMEGKPTRNGNMPQKLHWRRIKRPITYKNYETLRTNQVNHPTDQKHLKTHHFPMPCHRLPKPRCQGCGHIAHEEDPEGFALLVARFAAAKNKSAWAGQVVLQRGEEPRNWSNMCNSWCL